MSRERERKEGVGVFEAVVGENGGITLPGAALEGLGLPRGSRVQVRISAARGADALRRRGIREEEVDRICTLQAESRTRVVCFLLAEGAMVRPGRSRTRR